MTRMVPDTEALRNQPGDPRQRPQLCAVPLCLWPLQQRLFQLLKLHIRKPPRTAGRPTPAQRLPTTLPPACMPLAGCRLAYPQLPNHITLPHPLLEHLCCLQPKPFLIPTTCGQRSWSLHASTNTSPTNEFPYLCKHQ